MKRVKAWAWEWPIGELCFWACPSRQQLLMSGKPSPEAKAIRVWINKRNEKSNGKRTKPE